MKVIHCGVELEPLIKMGSVADVVGSLPRALRKLGVDVSCIIPYHANIDAEKFQIERVKPFEVKLGVHKEVGTIYRTTFASKIPIYLIRCDKYFNRDGIYGDRGKDYDDNHRRFSFFNRAILEVIKQLGLNPDVIHLHDWETALVPLYLKHLRSTYPEMINVKTVLTVHNISYQGVYDKSTFEDLGLPWEYFTVDYLEYYDKINFLKGGLVSADAITSLSYSYTDEMLTKRGGRGLQGVLEDRRNNLVSIPTGIDTTIWDPECDPMISDHFDSSCMDGKKEAKKTLQKRFSLQVSATTPLVVFIGRFVDEKGLDILVPLLNKMIDDGVQFIFQGEGEQKRVKQLSKLHEKYPGSISFYEGFDNKMTHMMEAGADFIVAPSYSEPAGLHLLYGLRYGTIPIVRAAGGLDDIVTDIAADKVNGCGIKFLDYKSQELNNAIERAQKLFKNKKQFNEIRRRCMTLELSWDKSAMLYKSLYENLMRDKKVHFQKKSIANNDRLIDD